MIKSIASFTVSVALLLATAVSLPDGSWPASKGTVLYSKPYVIKAGEIFDGKMKTYERSNVKCTGGEGQKDTAVFLVEAGGTLKNAIIGKNQKEGVHCSYHDCTIENVWWDDVCEDALSIKGGSASSVTTVTNCGARYAEDKVVQHNGHGTVKIKGFFAQECGKLYRSCGTCGNISRKVMLEDVYAIDPLVSVITVNKNYNDQATLKNIYVKTTTGKANVKVCQWSQGGNTPSNLGDGPSGKLCQYAASDVHINKNIPRAAKPVSSIDDASQTVVQQPSASANGNATASVLPANSTNSSKKMKTPSTKATNTITQDVSDAATDVDIDED